MPRSKFYVPPPTNGVEYVDGLTPAGLRSVHCSSTCKLPDQPSLLKLAMQHSAANLTPPDDLTSQIVLKSIFAERFGGFSDVFRGIVTKLVVDGQDFENIAVSTMTLYASPSC